MANTNGAFGLRPIGIVGRLTTPLVRLSIVLLQITLMRFFKAHLVYPLSTGFIDKVGAAAGGSVGLLGAFWGCEYVSSTTGEKIFSNYWPGSGADSNFPTVKLLFMIILCKLI